MTESCSFSAVTGGACGSSRGFTDCVALNNCDDDISSHLQQEAISQKEIVFRFRKDVQSEKGWC